MQAISSVNTTLPKKYSRLQDSDIARIPSLKINRADFYQGSTPLKKLPKSISAENIRNKIFTGLTFGLVGLYIAHRKNLFNPIRREARKIIKNEVFRNKVLEFAQEAVNPETYKIATRKFLNSISQDTNRPENFTQAAKTILNSDELLGTLDKNILGHLADDQDAGRLQRGFAVDVIDRLQGKIEKNLKKLKECSQEYKNQIDNIIKGFFTETTDSPSIVRETLHEAIINRSSLQIENFVKDTI